MVEKKSEAKAPLAKEKKVKSAAAAKPAAEKRAAPRKTAAAKAVPAAAKTAAVKAAKPAAERSSAKKSSHARGNSPAPVKPSVQRRRAFSLAQAEKHAPLTAETGITVELYRSVIRQPAQQRLQLRSLGLSRIGQRKVLPKIPTVVKLVARLPHLVRVIK